MTLTDKRVRSALLRLSDELAKVYGRAFKAPPRDEFWVAFDKLDRALTAKLEQRPIGDLEIDSICKLALTWFRDLCTRMR